MHIRGQLLYEHAADNRNRKTRNQKVLKRTLSVPVNIANKHSAKLVINKQLKVAMFNIQKWLIQNIFYKLVRFKNRLKSSPKTHLFGDHFGTCSMKIGQIIIELRMHRVKLPYKRITINSQGDFIAILPIRRAICNINFRSYVRLRFDRHQGTLS